MTVLQRNIFSLVMMSVVAMQFSHAKPAKLSHYSLVGLCCTTKRKNFPSRMARLASSKNSQMGFLYKTSFYHQVIRQKLCIPKNRNDDLCHHDICQQHWRKQNAIIEVGRKKTIQPIWVADDCRRK